MTFTHFCTFLLSPIACPYTIRISRTTNHCKKENNREKESKGTYRISTIQCRRREGLRHDNDIWQVVYRERVNNKDKLMGFAKNK